MNNKDKKAHELTMRYMTDYFYRERILSMIYNRPVSLLDNDFEIYNSTYQAALEIVNHMDPVE